MSDKKKDQVEGKQAAPADTNNSGVADFIRNLQDQDKSKTSAEIDSKISDVQTFDRFDAQETQSAPGSRNPTPETAKPSPEQVQQNKQILDSKDGPWVATSDKGSASPKAPDHPTTDHGAQAQPQSKVDGAPKPAAAANDNSQTPATAIPATAKPFTATSEATQPAATQTSSARPIEQQQPIATPPQGRASDVPSQPGSPGSASGLHSNPEVSPAQPRVATPDAIPGNAPGTGRLLGQVAMTDPPQAQGHAEKVSDNRQSVPIDSSIIARDFPRDKTTQTADTNSSLGKSPQQSVVVDGKEIKVISPSPAPGMSPIGRSESGGIYAISAAQSAQYKKDVVQYGEQEARKRAEEQQKQVIMRQASEAAEQRTDRSSPPDKTSAKAEAGSPGKVDTPAKPDSTTVKPSDASADAKGKTETPSSEPKGSKVESSTADKGTRPDTQTGDGKPKPESSISDAKSNKTDATTTNEARTPPKAEPGARPGDSIPGKIAEASPEGTRGGDIDKSGKVADGSAGSKGGEASTHKIPDGKSSDVPTIKGSEIGTTGKVGEPGLKGLEPSDKSGSTAGSPDKRVGVGDGRGPGVDLVVSDRGGGLGTGWKSGEPGSGQKGADKDNKDNATDRATSKDAKGGDKGTGTPANPDKKDGDARINRTPDTKGGDATNTRVPDKKAGDETGIRVPDRKAGDETGIRVPDRKAGDETGGRTPDKKGGDGQIRVPDKVAVPETSISPRPDKKGDGDKNSANQPEKKPLDDKATSTTKKPDEKSPLTPGKQPSADGKPAADDPTTRRVPVLQPGGSKDSDTGRGDEVRGVKRGDEVRGDKRGDEVRVGKVDEKIPIGPAGVPGLPADKIFATTAHIMAMSQKLLQDLRPVSKSEKQPKSPEIGAQKPPRFIQSAPTTDKNDTVVNPRIEGATKRPPILIDRPKIEISHDQTRRDAAGRKDFDNRKDAGNRVDNRTDKGKEVDKGKEADNRIQGAPKRPILPGTPTEVMPSTADRPPMTPSQQDVLRLLLGKQTETTKRIDEVPKAPILRPTVANKNAVPKDTTAPGLSLRRTLRRGENQTTGGFRALITESGTYQSVRIGAGEALAEPSAPAPLVQDQYWYDTKNGDTFHSISMSVLNESGLMWLLVGLNTQHSKKSSFEAGIRLRLPTPQQIKTFRETGDLPRRTRE